MDSLVQIRNQLADICEKTSNTELGDLITSCATVQINVDKWCKNQSFLLYSLPMVARIIYENKNLINGIGEWVNSRAIEIVQINEIPFMNDQSDLEFLDKVVKLINVKIKEIGPILFCGLAFTSDILFLFACEVE